ncbi:MAG: outer membrane beta-barrel protein [Pseudomonadota bacterium]
MSTSPKQSSSIWITLAAAIALAALPTGDASAQIEPNDQGFSVAPTIGYAVLRDEDGSEEFEGDSTAIAVDFEWRLMRYLGLGINVTEFGEAEDEFNGVDTTLEANGFGFFVRGILPVSDYVELYARVGRFAYSTDLTPGGGSSFLFNEDADEYGVGIDIRTSTRWSIRLEHRELDGEDRESASYTGIGFRFQL